MEFGGILNNLLPSSMAFPAIDIGGMTKRLRLREKGKANGSNDIPPPDSQGLDAVEQEIVNEIENEAKTQFDAYLDYQKTYADRAADLSVHGLAAQLGSVCQSAITDFARETAVGTGELYARKREVIDTERELNRFRKHHKLPRPPRNYGNQTVKVGVLLLILVVEAVLNGTFLAKGNTFGLVGGVFEALIIAGINITLGWGYGRLIAPWLAYRNWFGRVLSAVASLAYLAIAAGFNLAVAHYRTAVAGEPFEASLLAYRSLIADPLDITDLQSWALFIIGLLFSIAAAIDGWLMDDPYPGYGQRMRHNLKALDAYNTLQEQLLQDLEDIKKAAEQDMDDTAQAVQDRQTEFGAILLRCQTLRGAMEQHFQHLESAANTLLTIYRDENRKHRSAPAPRRFELPWTYQHPSLADETPLTVRRGRIDEIVRQVLDDLPRHHQALHTGFREALNKYKEIDDLVTVETQH